MKATKIKIKYMTYGFFANFVPFVVEQVLGKNDL